MKKRYTLKFLIVLVLCSLFFNCSESIVDPNSNNSENNPAILKSRIISSCEEFGVNMLKKLNSDESQENIFFSPLSISIALSMACNGADGQTETDILKTLCLSEYSIESVNDMYRSIITDFTVLDTLVDLEIANSIWYKDNFHVEQDFLNVNEQFYNADIFPLNFTLPEAVTSINNWVSDKTHEIINQVIDRIAADAVMFLINAIYFKADWKKSFHIDSTKTRPFYLSDGTTTDCDLMKTPGEFSYYESDDLQTVELPYGNNKFSLLILLPSKTKNINSFISDLSAGKLASINSSLVLRNGSLSLPKFKIEYQKSLSEALISSGMSVAFSDGADFSKINSNYPLCIDDICHYTYLKVDEVGTEAAAATIITMVFTSVGDPILPPFEMVVDRPFVLVIKERETGTIIFLGKIENPEKIGP